MVATQSRRLLQIYFLARLRAHQRGGRFIEIGDVLAALVVEDQGGYAEAISVIPPAPRVKLRPGERKSYSISYFLSFGGLLRRRGPTPGPKQPFFSAEAASSILPGLEECLPRAPALAWQQRMVLDVAAERVWAAAAAIVYKPRPWPNEAWRSLAAVILFRLLHHKQIRPLHLLAAALEEESDPCVQVFLKAGITREKVLDALKAGRR